MLNLDAAKKIKRNYTRRLNLLQIQVRQGDKQAAVDIIKVLADYYGKLKDIGFRITDEDGKLVPITQEWIDTQLAKETKLDKLTKEYRNNPSPELLRQIILEMNGLVC